MYSIGDIIEVLTRFKYDGVTFNVGDKGKVVNTNRHPSDLGIEWVNKTHNNLHDCGGDCLLGKGYNIDKRLLKSHTILSTLDEQPQGNPLPTDPRLRGIALKIIQLDTKFKRYQELKKSGQLHLLREDDDEEDEDEWEENYDVEEEHEEYMGDGDYETVRG